MFSRFVFPYVTCCYITSCFAHFGIFLDSTILDSTFSSFFFYHISSVLSFGFTSSAQSTVSLSLLLLLLLLLLTPWKSLTSPLDDGLSLEIEWQQVSSSLQDSSQYSDLFHSSSYFQPLQSLYQSFGDCTKSTNYNWYKRHFNFPQFFFKRSRYLSFFSFYFNFILWSAATAKS